MRRAREVVLVSKDINMRVKARALGLATDDYQNDKTLEDGDLLYSGSLALPADFWTARARPSKAGTAAATPSTASAARSWAAC
jgi:PhoH-like ATPase